MKFHWYLELFNRFVIKSGFPKFIYCRVQESFALAQRILFIAR